jgi:hypothetical protein
VKSSQKISDGSDNFVGILDDKDSFGSSVASLGDLDGDAVTDLVVGARKDDDGGPDRGAVYVLFLTSGGTVKSSQKISDGSDNFVGILDDEDSFGSSVASLGDLDGDAVTDLVVGARSNKGGGSEGSERGAVWVLFLQNDGTVNSCQKIFDKGGTNFEGVLADDDRFGTSVTSIGDFDHDGTTDLVVGSRNATGAVWVLYLNGESNSPTLSPTASPSGSPTASPTTQPTTTESPTSLPTAVPTESPTESPTKFPTEIPTALPTTSPSAGA